MEVSSVALPALVGAMLQEVVHWYDLRNHLDQKKHRTILKSRAYWISTSAMVAITPVVVHFWFAGETDVSSRMLLLTGASVPLLFKKAIRALTSGSPEDNLGAKGSDNASPPFKVSDYFSR